MTTEAPEKRFLALRLVRGALEIAAVVVFLFVLRQNFELRRDIRSVARRGLSGETRFAAGDPFPVFNVVDRAGKAMPLALGPERTLLLIADPGCSVCDRSIPLLPADAVVLSVTDLASTRSSPLFRFPGRVYAAAEQYRERRLGRVPQFLLVESQRIVRTCADPRDCR